MNCQKCEHRNNGICEKYDLRLKLKAVEGDVVEFEEVEECEEKLCK